MIDPVYCYVRIHHATVTPNLFIKAGVSPDRIPPAASSVRSLFSIRLNRSPAGNSEQIVRTDL